VGSAAGATAGAGVAVGYAIHLLASIMRNPEAIGSWIPNLLSAWEIGKGKLAEDRLSRKIAEAELRKYDVETRASDLETVASQIRPAENVMTIGAGPVPRGLPLSHQD
jgi:hypothetical protein